MSERVRACCLGTGVGDVVVVHAGREEGAVEGAGEVDGAAAEIRRRRRAVVVGRAGHARRAVAEAARVGQVHPSVELEQLRARRGIGRVAQGGDLIGGEEGRGRSGEGWSGGFARPCQERQRQGREDSCQ